MKVITCAPNIGPTPEGIWQSSLFNNWVGAFDAGWKLESFAASDGLVWGGAVRMLFATVTLCDPEGQRHTRIVFLRGGTVDTLVVLVTPDGREHLVLVEEKRIAVGRTVLANSAGMIEGGEPPVLSSIREVSEEVGVSIEWAKPYSLNEQIFGSNTPLLVSPGGTDEEVFFYVIRTHVNHLELIALNGVTGGVAAEDEQTTVRIVPIEHSLHALAQTGKADLKAITALGWYLLRK